MEYIAKHIVPMVTQQIKDIEIFSDDFVFNNFEI